MLMFFMLFSFCGFTNNVAYIYRMWIGYLIDLDWIFLFIIIMDLQSITRHCIFLNVMFLLKCDTQVFPRRGRVKKQKTGVGYYQLKYWVIASVT